MMYDIDFYTSNGTIIHNECQTLDEVFDLIRDSIDVVNLINLSRS